jgi:hypothetical protein
MKPLRKGARSLNVEGVEFSFFVGKTFVEVRNRATDKAYHVPKDKVMIEEVGCDCGCGMGWGYAVTPGQIGDFIRNHRAEHSLL